MSAELTQAERDAIALFEQTGTYSCACAEDVCPVLPCQNDREDLFGVVERILGDRLARVEALAEDWASDRGILSPDSRYTRDVLVRELRAALAPAPTEGANVAQIGSDERVGTKEDA